MLPFILLKEENNKNPFDVFPLEAAAHLPYLYAPSVPVSLRYTSTFVTLCTYRYKDIKRKNRKNRWVLFGCLVVWLFVLSIESNTIN